MRKLLSAVCLLMATIAVAQTTTPDALPEVTASTKIKVKNPFIWADAPDPDIIRVGDYYYLVTTTMHMFPGAPIMRSKDLVHWETVSYLFDEIKDTPRYDLKEGTVYGRGQWATTLRYHKGTFWALFVANDDPHKSMVFKTDDPAKGWKLHSRLPAYHDSSLFFDDDDRVYVFSGSGDITLVELNADLTGEKPGGIRKKLELRGKPQGLHEGSRVVKHDGMYYLLCIAWPGSGREEIAYRSKNIEGPYDSKVILKSKLGGFNFAGQGTIVDGKHGEWYGVMFQDRDGVGRVLTIEPCSWIDGWPVLGTKGDGIIPEVMTLDGDCECHKEPTYAVIEKDYQWNHNYIKADIAPLPQKGEKPEFGKPMRDPATYRQITSWEGVVLKTSQVCKSIYDARNTLTWRTWGPTCSDTICIDARKMKEGDCAGFAALNGDSGVLTIKLNGGQYSLTMSEENVSLSNNTKEITDVKVKEVETVKLPKGKVGKIYLCIDGDFDDFSRKRDTANFYYSLDGKTFTRIGTADYKMRFDYRRLFMGTRYAAFYYATKQVGGQVSLELKR